MKNAFLNEFLNQGDSTTLLLEFLGGTELKIKVVEQTEETKNNHCIIKRVTKLFFESEESPALYCISFLDRNSLTNDEYQLIKQERTPIGKVFLKFNQPRLIQKKNTSLTKEVDQEVQNKLNVKTCLLYKKEYEYWVAERKIGKIMEAFNEESLERISVPL